MTKVGVILDWSRASRGNAWELLLKELNPKPDVTFYRIADLIVEGKLSPFQIFYSQVCGHAAGLLAREAGWTKLPTADQLEFKCRLQSLGLLALPSASTVRRAMKSSSEIPPTKGGKDGA